MTEAELLDLDFNDPFDTSQPFIPRPPALLWLDDTCGCGVALQGEFEPITGECSACFDMPQPGEA